MAYSSKGITCSGLAGLGDNFSIMKKHIHFTALICMLFLFCTSNDALENAGKAKTNRIPIYKPEVYRTYPHDENAFTEGLFFADGYLYESTGLYGQSILRKVEIQSGSVIQKINLSSEYFGEGIASYDDKIVQLTWRSNRGFVYSKKNFKLVHEFSYPTEGWGITYDGKNLIMSDGTAVLHYLSSKDFSRVKEVNVTANGQPVTELNELEYINGKIYANIWQTDKIAIIQPDGEVIGWIDLGGILSPGDCTQKIDVLNGIAYNAKENRMYVTGKYWCKLFELEIVP
jgi:glutaminyl-peptide cyclotransferase